MSPESMEPGELCQHGKLPGICEECLKTEEGQEKKAEISEQAKDIGSQIAKKLEKKTGIKPYDVLMVLGAGYSEKKEEKEGADPEKYNPGWMLNYESKLRLNGAAQLYLEGRTRLVCVTGGKAMSEKWKDYPSLAELGKTYLIEKFGIPEKDIIFEDQSDATHGNLAHGLREMYENNIPVGSFAMISSNYHLNRARKMAEESGIEADLLPAESQLLRKSSHYGKFVANWLEYAQSKGLESNEIAKLKDKEYWEDRAGVFKTSLDKPVPEVDVSKSVADTAKRLSEAGAKEVQTDAF